MPRKRAQSGDATPPRRRNAAPVGVGAVIDHLRRATELGTQLDYARIWEHWPSVAGATLSPHGHPLTVKDGVLHIAAESAVWMHRFAYKKWAIMQRVNRLAGRELVSDVFVVLEEDDDASEAAVP